MSYTSLLRYLVILAIEAFSPASENMNLSKELETSVVSVSGRLGNSKEEMEQLFPNPVDTLKGSITFAKNCTLLALSVISYSRGMFPVHAYIDKKFIGHNIKVLNGHGRSEEAQMLWKWMRSACKAIEKGYMRELIFEVLSVEESIIEYYAIEYSYDGNNIKCSVNATEKTIAQFDYASFKSSFVNLMASIASFVKVLEPLPAAYKLQLRVNYYDADTPETYIPDYFRDENLDPNSRKGFDVSSMGIVTSPFHRLTVKMASCLKRNPNFGELQQSEGNEGVSDEQLAKKLKVGTQPAQKMSLAELERSLMSQGSNTDKLLKSENESVEKSFEQNQIPAQLQSLRDTDSKTEAPTAIIGRSVPSIQSGPSSSGRTKSTPTLRKSGSQEYKFGRIVAMNCICNLNDNTRAVFECYDCKKWHHLVCYKRKPTYIIIPTEKYVCSKCAIEDESSQCLDPTMAAKNVPIKNIQDLAVYRQVIFRLQWFTMINMKMLIGDFHIREEQARSIIIKLNKKNILRPCTRSEDFTLNTSHLMAFVNSYFK